MKQEARENCARAGYYSYQSLVQDQRLFLHHISACPMNNSIMVFGISVSGTSYVSHNPTNSSGFVFLSYLTDYMRTRSIALLLDINSCVARVGLLTRVPVLSTVNVVRGVNLVASSSRRSIVFLLGLVEPASAPTAFRILQAEFCANSIQKQQQ
uniref:Uncharacterized protein n=1 Tax=Glossina pallidipes TaxID=7398 RepID=A0A1B0AJG3_GLOPL